MANEGIMHFCQCRVPHVSPPLRDVGLRKRRGAQRHLENQPNPKILSSPPNPAISLNLHIRKEK